MITTIITSPEIEKYMDLNHFNKGETNEINSYRLKIASGGVYSAYIVKLLQGEPFMLGFAGGLGGRYIKNYLDKHRIKSSLLYKENEIKSSFIINDGSQKTILIDNNAEYDESDAKNLKHKIAMSLEKTSVYVISGSLKTEPEKNIISTTLDFIKEKSKFCILSLTDGYMDEFLKEKPLAIVADISQFKELENMSSLHDKLDMLRSYLKKFSIRQMLITDNKCLYGISKNKIVSLDIENTKDIDKSAILGALSISLKRKYEFEKTVKLVGAVAASFDSKDFPDLVSRKKVDEAKAAVKLIEIYSNGVYKQDV